MEVNLKKQRIETLDWLRGLMALSIMYYHITGWNLVPLDSTNSLGRIGVYGVSIFFVLSGLSMAIVYNSYIKNIATSINFFIRRIFRIWPLLWVVCFFIFIQQYLTGIHIWKQLFVNITTLFGFYKPTAYMATGAWSIGNEMVYYALTPLVFCLYNYKKWAGNVFLLVCFFVGLFFAFFLLDPLRTLSDQWAIYVNPFNNLFLYVMGIGMFYNFKDVNVETKINSMALVITVLLFCFLPFEGDQIVIVAGIGRIVFVLLSLSIVFCFYKMKIKLPSLLSYSLELLGLATYGVYLIHPIVYFSFFNLIEIKNDLLAFVVVPLLTIIISIISYKIFELKFITLGKKLTSTSIEPIKLEKSI
jgi:exopolysaccharide production protein ExoZ